MDELNVLANQGAKLEPNADGSMTVVMGRQDWPFPVPLVREADGVALRHRGRGGGDRQPAGRPQRAGGRSRSCAPMSRRSGSTRSAQTATATGCWSTNRPSGMRTGDQRDGLYWPTAAGDGEPSPFGPFLAEVDDYSPGPRAGGRALSRLLLLASLTGQGAAGAGRGLQAMSSTATWWPASPSSPGPPSTATARGDVLPGRQ